MLVVKVILLYHHLGMRRSDCGRKKQEKFAMTLPTLTNAARRWSLQFSFIFKRQGLVLQNQYL
jgi:hypothetical protein